jgi:hypothetical protein
LAGTKTTKGTKNTKENTQKKFYFLVLWLCALGALSALCARSRLGVQRDDGEAPLFANPEQMRAAA